jgi:hypothetical protein
MKYNHEKVMLLLTQLEEGLEKLIILNKELVVSHENTCGKPDKT